jgi:hypothetical protein
MMEPEPIPSYKARAEVDGAIVRTILPLCYSIIDRLIDAKGNPPKALLVEAGRMLPPGYRNSFSEPRKPK